MMMVVMTMVVMVEVMAIVTVMIVVVEVAMRPSTPSTPSTICIARSSQTLWSGSRSWRMMRVGKWMKRMERMEWTVTRRLCS
jgi:hypothetical protein